MKNVIWWVGILNPEHKEKYGGYDYFEYSKKTWSIGVKKMIVISFTLINQ